MNKPVKFTTAKLLKEKNIDIPCSDCYAEKRIIDRQTGGDLFIGEYKLCGKSKFHKRYYSAPTIVDVVMWLYEKHRIWIELTMGKDHTGVWFDWDIFSTITPRKDDLLGVEDVEYKDNPNEKWLNYDTTYSSMIDKRFITMDKESCSSPTEAYEAAIEYTLQKLIP